MIGMIVRRLLQLPLILLVIYSLTLMLAWAIPGNPLERDEGRRPPAAVVERMKAQYNLDSFWKFYGSYLASATGVTYARERLDGTIATERAIAAADGVAPRERRVFDLGPSLSYEDWSVNEIITSALPVSATLGMIAMLIALVVGVSAGVVGAVRPNSWADIGTLAVALIGISLPSFVTGTVLLLLFSVWIPIFPVAGWGSIDRMIAPAIALSLPFAAYIARLTRMGMIETLGADYIRTARAKGASERSVILRHALKNAFLPVLSFLGPATALAMTGSFIVERVFTIPGLGQHFVNAVQTKDLFLIMGVVLVFATMLILFNLAVDVMYRWVDPRIEQ
ncbi:MAG: ABC transporter permease [Phycisphaeraceae bacterium]|nr:ABC transporter permease [Phycisphaeraceae bacterium]MCW5762780.1 ABC transporter permease [Phycisphaeraceae bacterium]